ncbi:unnamed protein product [Callosobruchus maculatus]|nr:unnamed protein product [Callosobruchus maculatus]
MLKKLYKQQMYTVVYLLFCALLFSAVFLLSPLVATEREIPYKSIYPFDWTATPMYQITYALHFISINLVDWIVVGFDSLFMGICFGLTCQYILLGRMFLELGNQRSPLLNGQYSMTQCCPDRGTLVMCIKHMQLLSKTTENVEKVFNLAAAFQLGSSVVAICVSSFIATRDDVDATQIISMSSYLIGHLVQLFIYCNVGNELHFQSSQLSESIYTSRWNEVNCLKLKKDLVFVLMKSQVPAKITAFKVLTLNYETL